MREIKIEQKLMKAVRDLGGVCPKLVCTGFDGINEGDTPTRRSNTMNALYRKQRNRIIARLTRNLLRLDREAEYFAQVKMIDCNELDAITNAYANTAKTLLALWREREEDGTGGTS